MCDHDKGSMHKKVKKRYGSAIEHGRAHKQDHQRSRRNFLRNSGLFALGAPLLFGNTPVQALAGSPLLASLNASDCDRILVLIRLKGGNDGLNTIIQRDNDEYYNIRPTLAVAEPNLWALNDDIGMPNTMIDLQPFWEEGRMKIVQNVGYPDANYSHFRSSDIWASASDSNEIVGTGWIGRYMDLNFPAFLDAPPVVPPALQIGVQTNLVFRADNSSMALAISNPTEFYQIAQSGQLYDTTQLGNCARDQELKFVRQTANSAFRYSETIQNAYNNGSNTATYPANNLAEEMAIVARLIKGNLGTKVYMVSIGGFDTHSNQAGAHDQLLTNVASSVAAFFQDLQEDGSHQRVLAMTFSEFGRTIYENASFGTDHGTGSPMMIFGPETLGSELVGTPPDLVNVDMYGDPFFTTDFRSVYATVLQDWLCADPTTVDHIIGQPMDRIDGLVPPGSPSVGDNAIAALLGHNPSSNLPNTIEIKYAMKQDGPARLRILSTSGQQLRVLFNEFRERGSYTFQFTPTAYYLSPGEYIYQLDAGGKTYNRRIKW